MTSNLCSSSGCDQLMHLGIFNDVELCSKFSLWHHAQSVNELGSHYGESLIYRIYVGVINCFCHNCETILKENI